MWAELMAIGESDLFWEKGLGALTMLAGDTDMNRHTKFDPQTAPPVREPRATEERARLAMLLSAFGTKAWTRREGQWLQRTQQVRDGPTIQLFKFIKKLEESIRKFVVATHIEREANCCKLSTE